jgi:hypothetical protein
LGKSLTSEVRLGDDRPVVLRGAWRGDFSRSIANRTADTTAAVAIPA